MARSASLTRPVGTAGHVGTTECVTITDRHGRRRRRPGGWPAGPTGPAQLLCIQLSEQLSLHYMKAVGLHVDVVLEVLTIQRPAVVVVSNTVWKTHMKDSVVAKMCVRSWMCVEEQWTFFHIMNVYPRLQVDCHLQQSRLYINDWKTDKFGTAKSSGHLGHC